MESIARVVTTYDIPAWGDSKNMGFEKCMLRKCGSSPLRRMLRKIQTVVYLILIYVVVLVVF